MSEQSIHPDDRKYIEMIAREVQRVLANRDAGLSLPRLSDVPLKPASPDRPAPVDPPAGMCTAAEFQVAGDPSCCEGDEIRLADAILPLTGVVTASQLQAAMETSPGGMAILAHDAKLSPLANDFARQHSDRVIRAAAGDAVGADGIRSYSISLPWLWWIEGYCPSVTQIANLRRSRLITSGAGTYSGNMTQAIRDLASAVKSRTVAGGLLFVRSAARAACLANRCATLRAVVGACDEAVEQGIAELGANVLIIEYPHHGGQTMLAMVDRIMRRPPRLPPNIEKELGDLHRC